MQTFDGHIERNLDNIEVVPGEKQFLEYFERCKNQGVELIQIKAQLSYLEKQYHKEVTKKKNSDGDHLWIYDRTLTQLFDKWVDIQ